MAKGVGGARGYTASRARVTQLGDKGLSGYKEFKGETDAKNRRRAVGTLPQYHATLVNVPPGGHINNAAKKVIGTGTKIVRSKRLSGNVFAVEYMTRG